MKKIANMLPLLMPVMACLVLFSYVVFVFSDDAKAVVTADTLPVSSVGTVPLKEVVGVAIKEDVDKAEEAVTVGADISDAIGKVYEQFLSPYGAKLKYNNIYIKNSTGLDINIKNELEAGLKIKIDSGDEPQVLIMHTHATESYLSEDRGFYTSADSARNTDNEKNVIRVGEIMAQTLRNGGIGVIHDTTKHDYPEYNGSYGRAANTINAYLKKYPSIKIVVDVHRDSIAMNNSDKCKPVAVINGKKAAQVMLVMGSETGSVTDFPNWRENMRLAIRFHQTMEVMYPGLARTMLLASRRYNENLTTGSMILEVGTEANSFEEAFYSAELAGTALLNLLNTMK